MITTMVSIPSARQYFLAYKLRVRYSDVVKDKIARPRPRPRPRPSRPRPRPRTRTLKAKAKDTALEAKAKAKDTAFEAEAEAWTFDVKDEPKFQSQILQFSIGALWYLNCIFFVSDLRLYQLVDIR